MDTVTLTEAVFRRAAQAAAAQLGPLAAEHQKAWVGERDELQPCFKGAVERAAREVRPRPAVSPSLKRDLSRHYTAVGAFDLSLDWGNGGVAFAELKAGVGNAESVNCVWDLCKLAAAVRAGVAACGHLVVAFPEQHWHAAGSALEYLSDGEWSTADLHDDPRYLSSWRKWHREGLTPIRLPDRIRTRATCSAPFTVAETMWRLAVSRVEPVGDGWLDWVPHA